MRRIDRRHLLPGAAAFTAALLVALLGLNAGAEAPDPAPKTGAVEPGAEPGHASEPRLGRLEVAVEVVHAEQLQVDEPLALLLLGPRRLGAGVQAEQRNEKSGREGGRSGEQVAALGQWHGRKVW